MSRAEAIVERLHALHPKLIDLSLERLERALAALGHPERRLPPVVHVAGTNGKGSTCAVLRAITEAAGRRAHVYTSPHLVHFHERVRLAGTLVTDEVLSAALEEVEAANAGQPITVFEITTAAALLLFSRVPADVLVLEVGLGGLYDATNVVDRPAATAITSVSMDHMDFLGDSLAGIATEEAGIIKPGGPGATGIHAPGARAAVERIAAERRDEVHELRCIQVERRMERREPLGKEPFRGKRIRRVQTVIADEGYSGILEHGERAWIPHQRVIRAELKNLFQVMIFAGLVYAEGRHARLEAEFPDSCERLCVIHAPVEVHRHGIDGEPAESFDLPRVPHEYGD